MGEPSRRIKMQLGERIDIIVDMIYENGGINKSPDLKWQICDKFNCSARTGSELMMIAKHRYKRIGDAIQSSNSVDNS